MGDHRASIKIEIEFHGVKKEADWWINYHDSDGNGVDSRVSEFFSNVYFEGMLNHGFEMQQFYKERDKKLAELNELQELKRLKDKYEIAHQDLPHTEECVQYTKQLKEEAK
jgi:hypothetical protein